MRDLGLVKFNEPVKRLLTQGMVIGETFFDEIPNVSFFVFDEKHKHKGFLGLIKLFKDLQKLIDEVDFDKNGSIEFNEFVQCLAAVKDIKSRKKFERLLADYEDREVVDPSRSGGGI